LFTPYGPLRIGGSGALADGKLVRADLRVRPARLRGDAVLADLGEGVVRLTGRGGRIVGSGRVQVAALDAGGLMVEDGAASLEIDAPYPDGAALAVEGPLLASASLSGSTLAVAGVSAREGRVGATFEGRAEGPLIALAVAGRMSVSGAAAGLDGEAWELQAPRLAGEDLRLTSDPGGSGRRVRLAGAARLQAASARAGDVAVGGLNAVVQTTGATLALVEPGPLWSGAARVQFAAQAAEVGGVSGTGLSGSAATDLSILNGRTAGLEVAAAAERATVPLGDAPVPLTTVRGRFSGPARLDEGLVWRATGDASARGGLSPAEAGRVADRLPVIGAEDSHRGAILASLGGFDLRAPRLGLSVDDDGLALSTPAPVRMQARSGAVLTVAAAGGRRLWAAGAEGARGDFVLTATGGGLPAATLALANLRPREGGFETEVRLSASGLDAAIARNATVDARGRAVLAGQRFSFTPAGCIQVRAETIEFGENDLTDASAEVCGTGGPLISTDVGGYSLRGRFQSAGLAWPISEARGGAGRGTFDLRGGDVGLTGGEVRLAGATVTDVSAETRYLPLGLSGGVGLRGGVWNGRFDVASGTGVRIAAVDVTHRDGDGIGSAVVDARGIAFAPGGLQPEALSPLLAGVAVDATGAVDFTGRVDWTPAGSTSEGRLTTGGVDFRSPAGGVNQVVADVAFTSLTHLISAPEQLVSIRRVDALADITDATTRITLGPNTLTLDSTRFGVAGGIVRIDSFSIPLDGSGAYSGVVVVDGVQLGQVMAALNLAEQISLDAVVDGRIPFEVAPGHVRFTEGKLVSRQPGRVEISREALTGVNASGADAAEGGPAPVNAVQEFAYQAMENLAFDSLELEVNSLPEGRLGLLFRVNGEHDPEVAEEARVGWLEALRGRAFQRRIPLPKGTPVNLTLDTSLNFDELLQAWLEVARSRAAQAERSAPVQPVAATQAP
jgi:hypothetical protein